MEDGPTPILMFKFKNKIALKHTGTNVMIPKNGKLNWISGQRDLYELCQGLFKKKIT